MKHCIYEFDVSFTRTVDHRDECNEHTGFSKHPLTKATVRIVLPEYKQEIAAFWCQQLFERHEKCDFKIVEARTHKIDVLMISGDW